MFELTRSLPPNPSIVHRSELHEQRLCTNSGAQDRIVTGEAATAFFADLSDRISPGLDSPEAAAAGHGCCVSGRAVAGCNPLHLLEVDVPAALQLPVQSRLAAGDSQSAGRTGSAHLKAWPGRGL